MGTYFYKLNKLTIIAATIALLIVQGCEHQKVRVNLDDSEIVRSLRAAEDIVRAMKMFHERDSEAFFTDPKGMLDESIVRLNQANRNVPVSGWEVLQNVQSYAPQPVVLKRVLPKSSKQVVATWEPVVQIFEIDNPIALGTTLQTDGSPSTFAFCRSGLVSGFEVDSGVACGESIVATFLRSLTHRRSGNLIVLPKLTSRQRSAGK